MTALRPRGLRFVLLCLVTSCACFAQGGASLDVLRVDFQGSRRVPQDNLGQLIRTRAGNGYVETSLQQDVNTLFATGRYATVKVHLEPVPNGVAVVFELTERRLGQ